MISSSFAIFNDLKTKKSNLELPDGIFENLKNTTNKPFSPGTLSI
jgi:hypothetical protein